MIFVVTWATWVLLCLIVVTLTLIFVSKNSKDIHMDPPGPRRWPIIGSILYMAKFTNTIDAFTAVAKEYGDIVTLKLGTVNSIVVSGVENIRQVLVTRAQDFDSRPGFQRFDMLFEGNRNNSLAFSDWSENQKKRREIVGHHSFPKKASPRFDIFQNIASKHVTEMIHTLKSTVKSEEETHFLKNYLLESTFKIFLKYMCDMDINTNNHEDFLNIMKIFDDIFEEVNTPCIGDIFPIVMPVCKKSHLQHFGEHIRKFIIKYCVEPKKSAAVAAAAASTSAPENIDMNNNDNETKETKKSDLLDEFLNSIGKDSITEETALFALEDMIGGHSAIGNMLTTVCVFLGQNPNVQKKIREEVLQNTKTGTGTGTGTNDPILLTDNLSYTEAVVWEVVRHIGSPLVPHVANKDTYLEEFFVKKGTVLFLNNGELNSSPLHWTDPNKFEPERFLKGGQVLKPDYYFPFGTGRRSCLGFKLLLYTSILTISNICTSFEIGLDMTETYKWQQGNLSVPGQGFRFTLKKID